MERGGRLMQDNTATLTRCQQLDLCMWAEAGAAGFAGQISSLKRSRFD